jgi:hypothetical protein
MEIITKFEKSIFFHKLKKQAKTVFFFVIINVKVLLNN